ncbi:MAG: hypothetical protein A3G24_01585 [Betaproteobacteria bacterium RIFCSPLOWO2_12_FULL_62_13]|nr:MAG: hypothetical protein A3G24_01585 [Betaproteobacteria bacterium RIFCSPLOWO2_12_FULL_62_13]
MEARDERWSEAIAGGSLAFVEKVKVELGIKSMFREAADTRGTYTLREPKGAYVCDSGRESNALMPDNAIPWEKKPEATET